MEQKRYLNLHLNSQPSCQKYWILLSCSFKCIHIKNSLSFLSLSIYVYLETCTLSVFVTDLILPGPVASAVLVTASTEVDKTGASYYGEQTLHYLATNGDSAVVQLRKCPLQIYRLKPYNLNPLGIKAFNSCIDCPD